MCKSKEEGGLGIKDVDNMNVVLLMKWKWHNLTEENAIWSKVLKHRYDNPEVKILLMIGVF